MKSKWFELKPEAIRLRKLGTSLREVEKILKIPRSTLSGWFKDVKLATTIQSKLEQNQLDNLKKARKFAVKWHNRGKALRLKTAENEALKILNKLDVRNKLIQDLALAMLYLGEGSKTPSGTIIGSSDPLILKFYITLLQNNYSVDISKIKCALHLRADQDPEKLKKYWSEELNIPTKKFFSSSIDQRTRGRTTYPTYNGVCVVSCGNIALQRRLVFLSRKFCEKIIERAVSSAGRASD